LLVVFLTVFIDLVGFGIVLPLLPRYSERFGAEGWKIGAIIASFSVMQLFLAPWWGRLSDRIGRRPVLLISNGGSAVAYGMFALAAAPVWSAGVALTWLLASRVFAGACGANIAVAAAYIADITPPEKRSKGMGLIGVAFGLGFILGPAIGAFSAHAFGLAGPGWVAAGLCGANFVLAWTILAESRPPDGTLAHARPRMRQIYHTLRLPRVGLLVSLYFLSTFCFAVFETTLPLLLGSPGFHPDDFVNPRGLAQKLVSPGASDAEQGVATDVVARLTPAFRERLEAAPTISTVALRGEFFREFNRLLDLPDLFQGEASETAGEGVAGGAGSGGSRQQDAVARGGDTLRQWNRGQLEEAFPAELKRRGFYFDESSLGYVFAYCGLISAFIQGGVIGRLVKRFGEPRLIVGSLVIFGGGMAWLPYAAGLGTLLIVLAVVSVGSALNRAPTLGLVSIFSPPDEQGGSLGVTQSAGTLARIVGPVIATTLYAATPHSPYFLAAGAALVAAGMAWRCLPSRVEHGGVNQ
jgi:MFS family permease